MILLGCGHIGQALCRYGADLGFSVTAVDERPDFANYTQMPEASEILCDSFPDAIAQLGITPYDYVCVITRGHRCDADCLRAILPGTFPKYLGMIGSKRRVALLLRQLETAGIELNRITLHVGLGTFRPVKEDEIEDHEMHSEFCVIPEETARIVTETKKRGGRIVAVGTTSCRTLESFSEEDGTLRASSGWTNIFIYPGYRFKCIDALVTNFHLPESTLIMLVSALAGRESILNAYRTAVEERYRFFSFGDAMFIH